MATYLIIYDTKKEATAYHAAGKQVAEKGSRLGSILRQAQDEV